MGLSRILPWSVRIFDQGKLKRRDQGFLNVRVSDVLGHAMYLPNISRHYNSLITVPFTYAEMLTLGLRSSNNEPATLGKSVIYMLTNIQPPISNSGGPSGATSSTIGTITWKDSKSVLTNNIKRMVQKWTFMVLLRKTGSAVHIPYHYDPFLLGSDRGGGMGKTGSNFH